VHERDTIYGWTTISLQYDGELDCHLKIFIEHN